MKWLEIEDGYPRFEKGMVHHRLHWQKCLFLAGRTQKEAYDKVDKWVDIELPAIELISGYEKEKEQLTQDNGSEE